MMSSIPLAILTLVNPWFAALIVLALIACASILTKIALSSSRSRFKHTITLFSVIALLVTLSVGLLILPLNWIPLPWGLALLGLDFFFQAEDGIRDGTVTGVQTCALPI